MKKKFVLLITIIMSVNLFYLPCTVLGDGSTVYDLREIGISFTLPEGYSVQTKETNRGQITSEDVYLFAQQDDNEIRVRAGSNEEIMDIADLSQCSYEEREEYCKSVVKSINDSGIYQVNNWQFQDIQEITLIRIELADKREGHLDSGIEYYTIANGMRLIVSLHNYSGKIEPSKSRELESILTKSSLAEWAYGAQQTTIEGLSLGEEADVEGNLYADGKVQLPKIWREVTPGSYSNGRGDFIFLYKNNAQNEYRISIHPNSTEKAFITYPCYMEGQEITAVFIGDKKGQSYQDFISLIRTMDFVKIGGDGTEEIKEKPVSNDTSSLKYKIGKSFFGIQEMPQNIFQWLGYLLFYAFFYIFFIVILRLFIGKISVFSAVKLVVPYTAAAALLQWILSLTVRLPYVGGMIFICMFIDCVILAGELPKKKKAITETPESDKEASAGDEKTVENSGTTEIYPEDGADKPETIIEDKNKLKDQADKK